MTKVQIQKQTAVRMAKVRKAVEMIADASIDWSNEIRTALSKLPERERRDFIIDAGRAVAEMGDYIAAAGGAR